MVLFTVDRSIELLPLLQIRSLRKNQLTNFNRRFVLMLFHFRQLFMRFNLALQSPQSHIASEVSESSVHCIIPTNLCAARTTFVRCIFSRDSVLYDCLFGVL